jgi:hypothetical protein
MHPKHPTGRGYTTSVRALEPDVEDVGSELSRCCLTPPEHPLVTGRECR